MALTSLDSIKDFNETLKNAVSTTPPFGLEMFPSVIQLSAGDPKIELGRVINASAGNILAVFGIDTNNQFTISFLPLDENNKIITNIDGEESWPTESVVNFPGGLNRYL